MIRKSSSPLKSGFSLVELLVVIAIMAILMGLSRSAFESILATQGLGTAAENLANTLRVARNYAVAAGADTRVGFIYDTDNDRVIVATFYQESGDGSSTLNDAQIAGTAGGANWVPLGRPLILERVAVDPATAEKNESAIGAGSTTPAKSGLRDFPRNDVRVSGLPDSLTFTDVILFTKSGEAFIGNDQQDPNDAARYEFIPSMDRFINIGLRESRGGLVLKKDDDDLAIISINAPTVSVHVYRAKHF